MAAQSVDSNDIDIRIWHLVESKKTILLLGWLAGIRCLVVATEKRHLTSVEAEAEALCRLNSFMTASDNIY